MQHRQRDTLANDCLGGILMMNRYMRQVVLFSICTASFPAARAEPAETYKTRFPVSVQARARQSEYLKLAAGQDDRLARGLSRRDWSAVRAAFLETALDQAKRRENLPESYWHWLESQDEIRTAVLAGAAPGKAGIAFARLARLRDSDPESVELLPHLAVAFALVWATADDPANGSFLRVTLRPDCPVPPMEESFEYYVRHADGMLIPLNHFSWPLLVHVADIDIPISERLFLLNLFQDVKAEAWARGTSRFAKNGLPKWKQVGRTDGRKPEPTMQNILQYGGMCKRQSYFDSRASKSLGVPSLRVYDLPLHICASRITKTGNQWGLSWRRRRYAGHYRGTIKDSGRGCREVPVHHFEMLVDACNLGYDQLVDAMLATAISDLLPPEDERARQWLLELSIARNPCWTPAWEKLAAVAGPEAVPDLIRLHQRLIKEHPDVALSVVRRALDDPERLASGVSEAGLLPVFDHLGQYFARVPDHLGRPGRPDLCIAAALLRCEYVAAIGRGDEALEACREALVQFARDAKTGLPQVVNQYGYMLTFAWFQLNRAGKPSDYSDLLENLMQSHVDAFRKAHPKANTEYDERLYGLLTARRDTARQADNPLIATASRGDIAGTRRLANRWKPYLNDTDSLGRTALMHAAMRGRPRCIQVLLAAGADRDVKDANGLTALGHAKAGKKRQAIRLLQQRRN